MKCSKCGSLPKESDQFAWRCNSCKKVYRVSLKNIQGFAEKKKGGITEPILKCKECGAPLDDGNETIAWKCSCGNVQRGKLGGFLSVEKDEIAVAESAPDIIHPNLIRCPDCGREISINAKFCPECGCFVQSKMLPKTKIIKRVKIFCGIIGVICVFLVAGIMMYKKYEKNMNMEYYSQALDYYQADKLNEARALLKNIPNYEGVDELNKKITNREQELKKELEEEQNIKDYNIAVDLFHEGDALGAKEILSNMPETIEIENEIIDIGNVIEQIDWYIQAAFQVVQFAERLKNPDSLEIKEIYYSPISETLDEDVLFMTYKATNSFGAYMEETACLQAGTYKGEQYKDIDLADAILAFDQRNKLDETTIQNIVMNY